MMINKDFLHINQRKPPLTILFFVLTILLAKIRNIIITEKKILSFLLRCGKKVP